MNLKVLTRAAKMNQSKGIPESGIPEQKAAICTAARKGIKKKPNAEQLKIWIISMESLSPASWKYSIFT